MSSILPPSETVRRLLIWHQGALGDLLLAGPALVAISRHYPQARFTALGHPERWGLLSRSLPLDAVWDSHEALWANLFSDAALSPRLRDRLAPFQLALVFSPGPQERLQERLAQAGIPAVAWILSFPAAGNGGAPVAVLQAQHLAGLGIKVQGEPFRLDVRPDRGWAAAGIQGSGPWLAVAPGSGQACKNWPLSHYYELTRLLAWEHRLQVVWLAGPAEAALLPYLRALAAAQGHALLAQQPLERLARVLARCRLYLGNDSGLTHLAAAAGTGGVLAFFGPTDPAVWAPPGNQVRVLAGACPRRPCARGREIPCARPQCLQDLAPAEAAAVAAEMLQG